MHIMTKDGWKQLSPWIDHNANMAYDDVIVALAPYNKPKRVA